MKWTLDKAATELGIHKDTLAKGLIRAGLTVERGSRFTTLEVFRGYMGDLKVEQTRKTRAEADRLELQMEIERGNLIESDVAKGIFTFAIGGVRERFNPEAASSMLAPILNPPNPEHAKTHMRDWLRNALESLSDWDEAKRQQYEKHTGRKLAKARADLPEAPTASDGQPMVRD